ncbi:MAG: glycerophosphodiester phosphodiesterase family protein [Granulosicoccaceae bacterium]
MRRLKHSLIILSVIVAALWVVNSSVWVGTEHHRTRLLAHRGVHQVYAGKERHRDTCNASSVAPIVHPFIANTLDSMSAAFAHGADVVELDVHLTPDGVFAVFHDWTLGCQTDGEGVTHRQNFAYLQSLDIGYGYSADAGKSYPLRGSGVGKMPSLTEVLQAQLGGQYLINFKSRRAEEGDALHKMLQRNPSFGSQIFAVYGGAEPVRALRQRQPEMAGFDRDSLKQCFTRYLALGWSGYVPHACRQGLLAVPANYAPFLWGWPHRFTQRLAKLGTDVILWGPYDGSGFSSGIDQPSQLALIPEHFDGLVWSNKIEVLGPLIGAHLD